MSITNFNDLLIIEKEKIISDIADNYSRFSIKRINNYPYLYDNITDICFSYIPSGEYIRGFSVEEQRIAESICSPIPANLHEMRPALQVTVSEFLVSCCPVLETNDIGQAFPLYCNFEECSELCCSNGMRLPTESEWEYFARAGQQTLFPFGNELPDDDKLDIYMRLDFSDLSKHLANTYGLYGLFTGEWCSDNFTESYDTVVESSYHVIRGGAANFWPWQDEEWVWCMSAMRMPSSDLIDGKCAFRMVFDL